MNPIPYGRQHISQEDIDAVVEVLKGDFLTQGPAISAFEIAFSEYVGSRYAIAVSNGTAALHLAALALNIKPGDKVITTPITFAASANCVRYCDGEVVFADIDPQTYCLDIHKVRELLESSPKGTFKGIIPVDFAGFAVNLEEFRQLADEYGLWMIEDACHAPGGYFKNSNVINQLCGNGQYADISVFSFHPVKHIAAGEGGMITTNNADIYKKLINLRTHGITKESELFHNSTKIAFGNSDEQSASLNEEIYPGWYYEMQELGFNYRLTDFQAALGHSQLKRADEGLKRRIEIAEAYANAFRNKPFIKGQSGLIDGHAYHLYVIEVDNRRGLYEYLRSNNIFAQIHYFPLHLMPYYQQNNYELGNFPYAEEYYSRCLSLPMYPTLSTAEQNYVLDTIMKFFNHYA